MSRLTATLTMVLCCAGAAFAQTDGKQCCAAGQAAQATAQTGAQTGAQTAEKQCSYEQTGQATAQTVAATEAGDGKQCSADKSAQGAAQTVAIQTTQESGKQCSAGKVEATQVALADGQSCKTACSDAQAGAQTAGQIATGCTIDGKLALTADLPAMRHKVGDDITSCHMTAGELSQASGEPILYLVGQQSFDDAGAATRAYATELTSYLDKATRVTFAVDGECVACPDAASKACSEGKTLTYRVAGRDFTSAEAAIRAAAMAYAASRQVNLNYVVDGQCAGSCEKTAAERSIATAQPVVYRVGDKETKCDVQASVMLAIARIEAAVAAAQAVPQS